MGDVSQTPFRGSVAVARGQVTRARLRGPRYVRLFPDVYVDARVPITPLVRARAAAVFVEPADGAAAGYSAAEILGASCDPWHAPAEVLTTGHVRRPPGLSTGRGDLHDTGFAAGLRVTSPLRTAVDLARRLDLVEAVVAVDALAAARVERPTFVAYPWPGNGGVPAAVLDRSTTRSPAPGFDPAALLRWRAGHPRARGARRLTRVVDLADPRSGSPPETRLRLLLVLAGLPRPSVQHRVVDGTGREVRFDLAYPEALPAIEYDGEAHDDALDRDRDLRTAALGWETLRLLHRDLVRTPGRTVDLVRDLRARRAHLLRDRPA